MKLYPKKRWLAGLIIAGELAVSLTVGHAALNAFVADPTSGGIDSSQVTVGTVTYHDPIQPLVHSADLNNMVASGECWGDDNKSHPMPSRVWLLEARNSGDVATLGYYLHGAASVKQAFEQIFEGVDHGIEPAAFCK